MISLFEEKRGKTMAITEIHAITKTPYKALNYIMKDKIEPYISDDKINSQIPYEIFENNDEKFVRYFTLSTFQNCNILEPYGTYKDTQEQWQGVRYKNGGKKSKNGEEPLMYHLHQSFNGFEVSYEQANEIGRKLAEEVFKGFTVTISTHGNTNNIHNHFIISAWNNNGKKWDDCHRTKREIRKVSDRLCEEYGLSVLEHTRDMKLIRYEDSEGKIHYYEPTDRKNEIIKKREAKVVTTDDVSSYRNTTKYDEIQKRKLDNRSEIKKDIDMILQSCRSYSELLERLRELGYIIRDKKKNGDWLSHISFQAPAHDKATREDKIGDGIFYIRENLEKYIEIQSKNEQMHKVNHGDKLPVKDIPFLSDYEYGKTDLSQIDDNYKTVLDENGNYETVERTEVEKKVIADIRIKDSEVRGLIDTTELYKIISEQTKSKPQKKTYITKKQEEKLIVQIQSSFRCLQYTEQHHIYSYKQIIDLYSASKAKYDATIENFEKAEKAISRLKDILSIPEKLTALLDKIEKSKNDVAYILEEYNEDKKMVKQYSVIMKKYKIENLQGQTALQEKVSEFEAKQWKNRKYMERVILQMSELENCIRTFDRIDTENGSRNEQAMYEFEMIAMEQEKQNDKRKEKGYDR